MWKNEWMDGWMDGQIENKCLSHKKKTILKKLFKIWMSKIPEDALLSQVGRSAMGCDVMWCDVSCDFILVNNIKV